MDQVSVVGLGRLGLCTAACFAHRGARVAGVDVDPRTIVVYDPLAVPAARACTDGAALCVVTTPGPEFREADETYITRNPTTIIDCWRCLDPARLGPRVRDVALGRAHPDG